MAPSEQLATNTISHRGERLVGGIDVRTLAASGTFVFLVTWLILAAYTALFLFKGWIPHDEGLLAQSAERVLGGQLPQVDFDDPYTGGLSFLHALSFKLWGTRLASMRLLLFVAFLAYVPAVFAIAVRVAPPWIAAAVTALCVAWTLPNYFAPMPSWYNLFFAVFGALALLRHLDTGARRWLFAAGICGGLSFLVKLTGIYFIAAAALWLVYCEHERALEKASSGERSPRAFALILAIAMAVALLMLLRQIPADSLTVMAVIHFIVPPSAICTFLLWNEWRSGAGPLGSRLSRTLALQVPFACGVAVPIAAFLIPYAAVDGGLSGFYRGVFVLPALRLTFASYPLPPSWTLLFALPYALALGAVLIRRTPVSRLWVAVVGVALAPLLYLGFEPTVYQIVWFSLRPVAPCVVVLGCLLLDRGRATGTVTLARRQQLFLMLALTALLGLTQYPYAFGIYFCYFCPFLVLAVLSFLTARSTPLQEVHVCFLVFFLLFALTWVNTGNIRDIGVEHKPVKNTTPLLPERAGLTVTADQARRYEVLDGLIREHGADSRYIYAGPDTPELYFLSEKTSPLRTMYEFFDTSGDLSEKILGAVEDHNIGVVVINQAPEFSPRLDPALQAALIRLYPDGARVGWFWVLWRK